MAEEREQLRISAELDTSKLKQQAQQGMQSVVNEEKKVENQTKQVSSSMNNLGNSAQSAMRKVGNEAKQAARDVDNLAKSVKRIDFKQGMQLAGHAATMIAPTVLNHAASSGAISEEDSTIWQSAIQGGIAGAMMGSVVGPLGAAAGALAGAATNLLAASKEYKNKVVKDAEESSQRVKNTEESFDKTIQAREFSNWLGNASQDELRDELTKLEQAQSEKQGQIANERKEIAWTQSEYEFEKANSRRGNNNIDLKNKTEKLNEHQARLSEYIQAEAEIEAKRVAIKQRLLQAESREEAQTKARESIIANMQHEDKLKTEIKGLEGQVRNGSEEEFNNIRNGLIEAIKKNKEQMEKSAKDGPAFNKAHQELADNERKLNAVLKARQDVVHEQNEQEKTKYKNQIEGLQNELKDQESFMGRVSNVKLTDSLTKMGGGSGYGVQMQGINSYVSKMSGNVANIKTTIEKCLTSIQEIENKVSPYGGQFVGENE